MRALLTSLALALSVSTTACSDPAADPDAGPLPDAEIWPDAAPPDGSNLPCDPYAQDCPSGAKCSIVPIPDEPSVFRCVDDAGSQGIGSSCIPATPTTPDNCQRGAVCRGEADPRCMELCERDPDTCSGEQVCALDVDLDGDLIPDAHLCAPRCDPLAQDCVSFEQACYPSRLGTICALEGAGSTPAGQGEPCPYANSCARGMGCFGIGSPPDYRCLRFCDPFNQGGPGCGAGELCYRAANENWGVCY